MRLLLYLHIRRLMQKLFLLETTIHANLETRALFIALNFLNPKLPLLFCWHNLSLALHAWYLPLRFFNFHQNLLVRASILSQIFVRISKVVMEYVEIVWATNFIKVHLSAQDRLLLLQLLNLVSSLPCRYLKILEVFYKCFRHEQKELQGILSLFSRDFICIVCLMILPLCVWVALEKNMPDFSVYNLA